jgi:hypothetical protein
MCCAQRVKGSSFSSKSNPSPRMGNSTHKQGYANRIRRIWFLAILTFCKAFIGNSSARLQIGAIIRLSFVPYKDLRLTVTLIPLFKAIQATVYPIIGLRACENKKICASGGSRQPRFREFVAGLES